MSDNDSDSGENNDRSKIQESDKAGAKSVRPVMFCQTAARLVKTTGEEQAPSTPSRRRKEKRRMSALLFFRCTPDERTAIASKARNAGLHLSSWLRVQALGKSKAKRYRRIRADWDELRRCMGVINKAGSVVNQLVRALRAGGNYSAGAADSALAELRSAAQAIVRLLKQA
jgi:hypothetical protein